MVFGYMNFILLILSLMPNRDLNKLKTEMKAVTFFTQAMQSFYVVSVKKWHVYEVETGNFKKYKN